MKFREEIGRPGFVIDLMFAIFIFSGLISVMVCLIAGPGILHRDWRDSAVNLACWALASLLTYTGKYFWNRYKSGRRKPGAPSPA